MTLCVLGFANAEARKSSTISPNSGDLFLYFDFHFAQSVPAGALLQSSTVSMSLRLTLALFDLRLRDARDGFFEKCNQMKRLHRENMCL